MGIIDTAHFQVDCTNCDNTETVRVHDKGSRHQGSWWQSGSDFDEFKVQWKQESKNSEPELIKATCIQCGSEAVLSNKKFTQ